MEQGTKLNHNLKLQIMKKTYVIRDREAGNIISTFIPTKEGAEKLIKMYEKTDKKDGTYTPDFYEIAEQQAITPLQVEGFTPEQIQHNLVLFNRELFKMVIDLKNCIKRLTSDDALTQYDKDTEAQWEGEAHELLSRIDPNYYKNANE